VSCCDFHLVDDEGLIGHDRFISRGQKCTGEQAQDFIRSIPEYDLIQGHLPAICQGFTQAECTAVWVAMQGGGSLT